MSFIAMSAKFTAKRFQESQIEFMGYLGEEWG
jgi:hypothetical protein